MDGGLFAKTPGGETKGRFGMPRAKRAIRDNNFSDPDRKPSFKEFLLSMPDGELDYEMGVKAPE